MAHSLSAKKRVKQDAKKNMINRARKSALKGQIKNLEETLHGHDIEAAEKQFREVSQKLDRVASTSTMHKKTADRKKSRLAKRVNALKAKEA